MAGYAEFGVGAGIPKHDRARLVGDSSELDLIFRRGDRGRLSLVVEAKLAEPGFTRKPRAIVDAYAGLKTVFDDALLDKDEEDYRDYQLIRNILAADYFGACFTLLHDARRPDLRVRFETVRSAVRSPGTRAKCAALTWQEFSAVCPADLQRFLLAKYGIEPAKSPR